MPAIIGNETLKARLCHGVLTHSLPHAFILEGPRGSGKHTLAKMCAAALACTEQEDPQLPLPCMRCLSCRKILEGKSPDLITVGTEGKATVGVDAIRFLKEDIHVVPNDLDYKIYMIEDADRMTPQAQNALLLSLEEPPAYVHFFLLCENAGVLLETIRSRAPILRTEPIAKEDMDRYLCEHEPKAKQMKLSSPKQYAELLQASGSGIGQALEYLNTASFAPVLEQRMLISDFVESAVHGKDVFPFLPRFSTKRELLKDQLNTLCDALRDLILLKKSENLSLLFFAEQNVAIELCDSVSLSFLYRMQEAVTKAIEDNTRNVNTRLLLMRMLSASQLI